MSDLVAEIAAQRLRPQMKAGAASPPSSAPTRFLLVAQLGIAVEPDAGRGRAATSPAATCCCRRRRPADAARSRAAAAVARAARGGDSRRRWSSCRPRRWRSNTWASSTRSPRRPTAAASPCRLGEALLRRVDAGEELDLGGLRTIAVDEADAVLCGAPGPGVALLEAAAAAAPALQRIFAAAHLTGERLIDRRRAPARRPRAAPPRLRRGGRRRARANVRRQVYHFFTAAAKADVLLRVLRSAAGDARDGVAGGYLVFCADGATAEEVRARLAAELPADAPVAALHAATTADEAPRRARFSARPTRAACSSPTGWRRAASTCSASATSCSTTCRPT